MFLTPHAKMRRKVMGVTEHEIEDAIAHPDTTYPGDPNHAAGRICYQRGAIVVVAHGEEVVTVLWHTRVERVGPGHAATATSTIRCGRRRRAVRR